jgi:hypothetical protein
MSSLKLESRSLSDKWALSRIRCIFEQFVQLYIVCCTYSTHEESTRRVNFDFYHRSCHFHSCSSLKCYKYLRSVLSSTRNPLLLPHIHIRAQAMAVTMLPTPAASSSTSPTQLDTTDKKRPRESTASSVIQTPATKKAKADVTNGDSNAKETKGVFCHQSVQHAIRGREADTQMSEKG